MMDDYYDNDTGMTLKKKPISQPAGKISEEKAQRIADDAALGVQIAAETTNRANADQSLNRLITQVSADLSNEVSNRTNADALLDRKSVV